MSFKFKQIYLNGCSFMWGMGHSNPNTFQFFEETNDIDTSHPVHYNGKTPFNNYDWVRQKFNIGGRLKEHYGINVIDESIYGGSLQRAVRKTMNWMLNNNELVKDTLFILEWPIGVRREMYIELQKRYVNYTANFDNYDSMDPYIHRVLINEFAPNFFASDIAFLEDLHSLIGVISYIKQNGGEYLILLDEFPIEQLNETTLKYVGENKIKDVIDKLILPNTITFTHSDKADIKSLLEYYRDYEKATITKDTNSVEVDEHNSIRGSRLIAEQIIKNINELS